MALLTANGLSVSFGERCLFAPATFEIAPGEKIGLIGANGCGKTTLFRLLTGQMSPDAGGVSRQKGLRIGYMEQIVSASGTQTAFDTALTVFAELQKQEAQLDELTAALDTGDPEIIARQHRLRETFEAEGGLTYRARTRSALLGLGLTEEQLALPLSALSGGQLSKLALARLLLSDADLLLLDEPTNHLDIASVEWLETFLHTDAGAALIISHDRYFLDRVTSRTLEIDNGRLTDYKGNYSRSRELKEEQRAVDRRHYENTLREIERLEGVIRQQHQWNREKNIRTADSKQKVVDRLRQTLVRPDEAPDEIAFRFAPRMTGGNDVVIAEDLTFGYGGKPLYQHLSFSLRRGERVFLLGANGCGKTTLLKHLLAGGKGIRFGAGVQPGYFDQTQQSLSPEKTALTEIWDDFPRLTQSEVRGALAAFCFRGDAVFKKVGALSGGERARLMILKRMLAGDNLLLLDEQTNHLDLYARQALEDALADYAGTMLIVSHDRRFIDRLADRLLVMEEDGLVAFEGNYTEYLNRRPQPAAAVKTEKKPGAGGAAYHAKKEAQSLLRRTRSRMAAAEEELAKTEAALEEANARLSDPETASDYTRALELTETIAALTRRQEELLEEWAQAGEELEKLEAES